jgi:hypothetical protein
MGRQMSAGLVIISAFTLGCGGDADPGGPTRIRVEGQVISSRSRTGIADAAVSIGNILGNDFVTTTTDAEGRFSADAEYFECAGVTIQVQHTGYLQQPGLVDVCPGSSRTIELVPDPVESSIAPENPMLQLGGSIDLQLRVTFYDGTADENGEAYWSIGSNAHTPDTSLCGSVPDSASRGVRYTAPSSPPPSGCGPSAGQGRLIAAPVGILGGSLDASDTVIVSVGP